MHDSLRDGKASKGVKRLRSAAESRAIPSHLTRSTSSDHHPPHHHQPHRSSSTYQQQHGPVPLYHNQRVTSHLRSTTSRTSFPQINNTREHFNVQGTPQGPVSSTNSKASCPPLPDTQQTGAKICISDLIGDLEDFVRLVEEDRHGPISLDELEYYLFGEGWGEVKACYG